MATLHNKLIRMAVAAVVFASTASGLRWQLARAQGKTKEKSGQYRAEGVEAVTRFSETLKLTNPKGASVPLYVEFKDWDVTGGGRGTELPDQGFYVAHLVTGDITTEIGGKSELRHPGDFWTVEKGTRMVVQITPPSESAYLQTIAVGPAH
jgi:hypothetical protein